MLQPFLIFSFRELLESNTAVQAASCFYFRDIGRYFRNTFQALLAAYFQRASFFYFNGTGAASETF